MKKYLMIFAFILSVGWLFAQEILPFNDAINYTARGLENRLPEGANVMILNIVSPSLNFSNAVFDRLSVQLVVGGKVSVVTRDRQDQEARRQELNYQMSGEVSDPTALSIANTLGAHYSISGSFQDMENNYLLTFRIINIESSQIVTAVIVGIQKDTQVAYLLGIDMPISNIKDNWLSAEVSGGYLLFQGAGISVGARYERMLNSKISIGTNFYWFLPFDSEAKPQWGYYDPNFCREENIAVDKGNIFGIDAFIRFYPKGRSFFFGLALGYHNSGNSIPDKVEVDREYNYLTGDTVINYYYVPAKSSGLAITPELGWKISFGKKGGFFLQPSFLGSFIIGKNDYDYSNFKELSTYDEYPFVSGYWRFYLGAGWAF